MEDMKVKADQNADATKLNECLDQIEKVVSPLVVVRQHAVGHGGFHTGALGYNKPQIRWIYDCGAWRKVAKSKLKKRLKGYAQQVGRSGRVDILFLSHFDADHVSGVRQLLGKVQVETVIVPYLEREEIFGIIAEASAARARKQEIENLSQAMLNPGIWFGEQNVLRVIRLRPGPAGDELGATEIPPLPPAADRSLVVSFTGIHNALPHSGEGAAEVIDANPGLSGKAIYVKRCKTDWRFRPFVHPISDTARTALQEAATALVGVAVSDPNFDQRLIELIRSKDGLKNLRNIYIDRELADANGKSLSLYAGPFIGALRCHLAPTTSREYASGWLLTGDAKLRSRNRRTAWLQHYGDIPSHLIDYLMLPHHGATANFHPEIVSISESARLFVTCDAGDTLRPHEDIISELKEVGDTRIIVRVTQNCNAEIWQASGSKKYRNDPLIQSDCYKSWT